MLRATILTTVLLAPLALAGCVTSMAARDATGRCSKEDFVGSVSGGRHCMSIIVEDLRTANGNPTLFVTLHGDLSNKETVASGFKGWMARQFGGSSPNLVVVHFDRPAFGGSSGSAGMQNFDTYTDDNALAVLEAIQRLKVHYGAKQAKVYGHSGGAALIALGVGLYPDKAPEALFLASCPCDVDAWTSFRGWRTTSLSPLKYVKSVPNIKITAMTGEHDNNTLPQFAKKYVDTLSARGVSATFIESRNAGHNDIMRSADFSSRMWNFLTN